MKWTRPFDFYGSAGRAEFAAFFLGGFVAFYLLIIANDYFTSMGDPLIVGYLIAMFFLPAIFISAAFRRLHDLGRSGWTLLLAPIPVASWWLFLILFFAPGKPRAAQVASPSEKSAARQQDAEREKELFREKLGYPDDRTRTGSTETMQASGARQGNAADEDAYQQEPGEEEWLQRRRERDDGPGNGVNPSPLGGQGEAMNQDSNLRERAAESETTRLRRLFGNHAPDAQRPMSEAKPQAEHDKWWYAKRIAVAIAILTFLGGLSSHQNLFTLLVGPVFNYYLCLIPAMLFAEMFIIGRRHKK